MAGILVAYPGLDIAMMLVITAVRDTLTTVLDHPAALMIAAEPSPAQSLPLLAGCNLVFVAPPCCCWACMHCPAAVPTSASCTK
ncbi:hypothetical protein [Luteimonas sp. R10]|uniref:hypothetical protein n=1 Tax=Luteimonas sp. R10 TaxID=3108176 RepID=UPI00309336DC|nr:hypothetical protein U3649_10025 [Luteimonas sp. R10]